MARTQIGTIIDELVTLQEALTPTVSVSSFVVYDEAPENVSGLCWINFPGPGVLNEINEYVSHDNHTISCACVKDRALLPQDEKIMRPIITQFPDAVAADVTLNGTVAHVDSIEYEYGLIETLSGPDQLMFGVLFRVNFTCKDNL